MEGDAVSATIGVLIQNLIDLSKDEISLIQGLEGDAETLSVTFGIAQRYLDDAQTKSITDDAVKTWLKNLEAKAFDAENALDGLKYQLLSNKKVPSCFPSFDRCVDRRDLALKIREINKSFESIIKTGEGFHFQENLAAASAPTDAVIETNSFTVDPIFIGRDDDVSKIVGILTSPTEEALSILPVVGMGGLGKTTLARKVFNHEKSKAHFGQRIWVHVSQDFDAGLLLKKILNNLKEGNIEHESCEVVLKNLQEALKAATYILVLDDVWNEDHQKWEDFINSWVGITSTKGNVILVTTRSAGVGSLVKKELDMHQLEGLSDEQCWNIIKDRAFVGVSTIMPDLEEIGKNIAEKCRGLPLAANVVGGVLRGKSQDEWRSIREKWLPEVGGDLNYISRILKLSFDNLSTPSLKKCFAYCSIFSKGTRMEKAQLIELWMAEGFLQPSQTSDMETVGNQFLKVLLQNSLLNVSDIYEYGEVKRCTMHDLVHDVAGSILDGTYYGRDKSSRIPEVEAKWLRTLIYNGRISDIVFSDFKSLHSLTITCYDVKKLPNSIRKLIHLRYLNISETRIKYLPNSSGKLYHLQTIRAPDSMKKLPSTLKHLFNLRHLHVEHFTILPPQLGKLTSLQTLQFFKVRNNNGHRIVELGSLKNLKGKLKIYNLEKVRGEEESKEAYLSQKSGIVKLVLVWEYRSRDDENVLKGLQPHPNLKMLKIDGFGGASFPSWTLKMGVHHEGCWVRLSNLVDIRLQRCSKCEEIPTLGQLPHLKSLILFFLKKVKSIGASFYGIEECNSKNGVYKETISVFPALKRLELQYMMNLTEWEGVEIPSGGQVEIFPCLEYLKIYECRQLRSAPSQFTSLKELHIDAFGSNEWDWATFNKTVDGILGLGCTSLRTLELRGKDIWECLPDQLQHLTALEKLTLVCFGIEELPEWFGNFSSLKTLELKCCSNLKHLPSVEVMRRLTNLATLRIYECPLLEERCTETQSDVDSEWPKISHIHVYIDGRSI